MDGGWLVRFWMVEAVGEVPVKVRGARIYSYGVPSGWAWWIRVDRSTRRRSKRLFAFLW